MRLIGPRDGVGLLKIIILVVALLLIGAGGFFAWSKLRAAQGAEEVTAQATEEEEPPPTETLSLGEFLVNLRTSDDTLRYLQTEISIVVAAPRNDESGEAVGAEGGHEGSGGEEAAELPAASHRYARDVAIEVLSSQSFEHLRDQADRSKLKALLQQKLDAALDGYDVQDVLFTAFVMQ